MLTPLVLGVLLFTGMAAGFVDAVAGGGGLIGVPVLLAVGIPPVTALGTNKVQGVIGTATAAFTYFRRGYVPLQSLLLAIATAFVASFCGAAVVKHVDASLLSVAVPILLMAIGLYFVLAPKLSDADRDGLLPFRLVPLLGLVLGFYDGFFGPGTGSFMTMGFVALFGFGVTRATGNTKMLNLASNLGALALFIPSGNVLWPAALVMAVGQVIGGYLGAITGIRFGARLIRPLVVLVSVILALRLLIFR